MTVVFYDLGLKLAVNEYRFGGVLGHYLNKQYQKTHQLN
jgi:hypothetical protein